MASAPALRALRLRVGVLARVVDFTRTEARGLFAWSLELGLVAVALRVASAPVLSTDFTRTVARVGVVDLFAWSLKPIAVA